MAGPLDFGLHHGEEDFTMRKGKKHSTCSRPVRLRYILVPRSLGTN